MINCCMLQFHDRVQHEQRSLVIKLGEFVWKIEM